MKNGFCNHAHGLFQASRRPAIGRALRPLGARQRGPPERGAGRIVSGKEKPAGRSSDGPKVRISCSTQYTTATAKIQFPYGWSGPADLAVHRGTRMRWEPPARQHTRHEEGADPGASDPNRARAARRARRARSIKYLTDVGRRSPRKSGPEKETNMDEDRLIRGRLPCQLMLKTLLPGFRRKPVNPATDM